MQQCYKVSKYTVLCSMWQADKGSTAFSSISSHAEALVTLFNIQLKVQCELQHTMGVQGQRMTLNPIPAAPP